ncbi:sugar lactone lactonase YvrE [Pseudomonas duriflava]|uniref:Sugar lactone lactonase YvrE n=1 Tax=Pseudomonas duriflava TaxID=459528 RepID=A0A562QCR6_9PSED|nr:SMP-30/gluconolactonase/LRE family protein [Pseudomonas duriflava]TWI53816.1 sugar lactone lactonase YvrE [Pseudomonas duriflava]
MEWQPVVSQRYRLAEGPFWDQASQRLFWVDIAGQLACLLEGNSYREWRLAEPVSAFIPTHRGDALVTLRSGVYRLDLDSPGEKPRLSLLCVPDPDSGNRANEARCDAAGNLWLGSMQNNLGPFGEDIPVTRRTGGLFCIDAQARVTRLASNIGIANTLAWDADGCHVYTADTLEGVIYRYPIEGAALGPRSVWARPHEHGHPDGSALDREGYLWNARWDGHCLIRFAPDGCVDSIISVPAARPTSCVFGGPDLRTLFVTTAEEEGGFAGAVLATEAPVAGTACHRFAG